MRIKRKLGPRGTVLVLELDEFRARNCNLGEGLGYHGRLTGIWLAGNRLGGFNLLCLLGFGQEDERYLFLLLSLGHLFSCLLSFLSFEFLSCEVSVGDHPCLGEPLTFFKIFELRFRHHEFAFGDPVSVVP